MDFDLRQWLMILGPVFIIGVLMHGYIRMRAGQNQIRMNLEKEFLSPPGEYLVDDELSLFKAELPNGGARVITGQERTDESSAIQDSPELKSPELNSPELQSSERRSTDEVPVLVESVDVPSDRSADPDQVPVQLDLDEVSVDADAIQEAPAQASDSEPVADAAAITKAPPARAKPEDPAPKPEKFVVINVLALGEPFAGQRLLEILLNAGMAFGEMDIFHRSLENGEPAFSLASAVVPGTFDMKTMDTFTTPGVTLFMRVHELAEPMKMLDELLAVAETIAVELGGEICDETRSVMTPQTIEHCRQSIQEFQYKHSA